MPCYTQLCDAKPVVGKKILVIATGTDQFAEYRKAFMEAFPACMSLQLEFYDRNSIVYGLKEPDVHILAGGVDRADINELILAARLRQARFQMIDYHG